MKKIIFFALFASLVGSPSFAEERLDKIPDMSGKIEIMEQLGLIEHPDLSRRPVARKNHTLKKETINKNARVNHLADIVE